MVPDYVGYTEAKKSLAQKEFFLKKKKKVPLESVDGGASSA